ncbi:triphosphoribosyl-dephospho-CoA synthase, partial [Methylobacterium goesingense]
MPLPAARPVPAVLPETRTPARDARPAERIARLATRCLQRELATYPKPGLVSHVDSGSHADMDASTFRASAAALAPFFADLAAAGAAGAGMAHLRRIGLAAESAMRAATGGVNTHRGAIFGLGLLSAAAGALGPR